MKIDKAERVSAKKKRKGERKNVRIYEEKKSERSEESEKLHTSKCEVFRKFKV